MKFFTVAHVFEQIEKESSRLVITQMLADLFKDADSNQASIIANLSLGQLKPPFIPWQFNIAEKNMIPIIAGIRYISDEDVKKMNKKVGDLGLVIAEGDWSVEKKLTVQDVYDRLIELEQISGEGSQEAKAEKLTDLLQQVEPLSAKYIVRIVLGKLRLGFSDMTVIDALSWMETGDKSLRSIIEDAFNKCADIGLIAQTLKAKGVIGLEKMQIRVGTPIRPAAAERLPTARAIFDKIGPCVAQPKLDGFRLQVHLDKRGKDTKVHFFSRNLQDMSAMFPDLVSSLEQLNVETMIAEGEAIAYDANTDTFLPFQETVKRKRKHGIDKAVEDFPLKLFFFDLLYLNGNPLLNETHEERREKLKKVLLPYKGSLIELDAEKKIATVSELEQYFLYVIEEGLEGLVVKRPDAIYQPGKRNFNWIKLKRHQAGELEDTIDCIILGYYTGGGKRAQFGIGAFLVGVYAKNKDFFETIAKVGTGLTDDEWRELKKKCDAIKSLNKPPQIECPKELAPDVWVYPELVCVILADEITKSPMHTAGREAGIGYALRFPRFMGYRPDKKPTEATTVAEIKRLYEDQYKK